MPWPKGKKLSVEHKRKLKASRREIDVYLEVDRSMAEEDRKRFLRPKERSESVDFPGIGYCYPDWNV